MTQHSLFFALMPEGSDAVQAHALALDLCRRKRLSGAARPRSTLHVSLWPIGWRMREAPSHGLVDLAARAASQVTARPFTVAMNRVESWTRNRTRGPVALLGDEGVIGVDDLHRRLAGAFGQTPDQGFNAHMALAWTATPFAPEPVDALVWTVREFVLAHSFVGQSRYEILKRFPLTSRPSSACRSPAGT